MMRLYWPGESDPSILDGTWTIPAREEGELISAAATIPASGAAHDTARCLTVFGPVSIGRLICRFAYFGKIGSRD
jgi:hypothetical protein